MKLDIKGADRDDNFTTTFDPAPYAASAPRPAFLAIVASHVLATMLARRSTGRVNGFVVEGPTAGGHNDPPRGKPELSDAGEPVYGERDVVDLLEDLAVRGLARRESSPIPWHRRRAFPSRQFC